MIFLGALLTFFFAVGLASSRNPGLFLQEKRMDYVKEQFIMLCRSYWPLFGIIGIPMLLVSLVISLIKEKQQK